jgi:hypothetical protein
MKRRGRSKNWLRCLLNNACQLSGQQCEPECRGRRRCNVPGCLVSLPRARRVAVPGLISVLLVNVAVAGGVGCRLPITPLVVVAPATSPAAPTATVPVLVRRHRRHLTNLRWSRLVYCVDERSRAVRPELIRTRCQSWQGGLPVFRQNNPEFTRKAV